MHQRRRRIRRTQIRLYTALVLLVGAVLVLLPPLNTGIAVHEWASFLIIIPLLVHIVIDWKWIASVTHRIFKKQPGQTRFNYFWDWLLFIMVTVAVVSGVLISEAALPALGIRLEIDPFWTGVHIINSRFLMVTMGVHIAMHWSWIVGAVKSSPVGAASNDMDSIHKIDASVSSRLGSALAPTLIILLAAGLIALAALPWADAEWAESFRAAVKADREAEVERPRGIGTLLTDLYWVAVVMGVPALLTLGILRIGKLIRRLRGA